MGHKSRMKIKNFKCGHRGYGRICHLCKSISEGKLVKTKQGKYLPKDKVNPSEIES